jgi:hypothetical protein
MKQCRPYRTIARFPMGDTRYVATSAGSGFPVRVSGFRTLAGLPPVKLGIQAGVIVHFELPVDLHPYFPFVQFAKHRQKRILQVMSLLLEDFEFLPAHIEVLSIHVIPFRLLEHVIDLQCEDGGPVKGTPWIFRAHGQLFVDQSVVMVCEHPFVQFLDQIVPFLIQMIDFMFYVCDDTIIHIRPAGDILLLPKQEVVPVEFKRQLCKRILVPRLSGRILIPFFDPGGEYT